MNRFVILFRRVLRRILYSLRKTGELKGHFQIVEPDRSKKYWILNKFADVISDESTILKSAFSSKSNKAHNVLYLHFSYFNYDILRQKILRNSKHYVWFTHIDERNDPRDVLDILKYADGIFVQNSSELKNLKNIFVDKPIILAIPGVDETIYDMGIKERDGVIIIGHHYKRKRADRILEVVTMAQNISFTIFGENWENSKEHAQLLKLKNLKFEKFDYMKMNQVLNQHKVLLNLSEVEGGPMPILEGIQAGCGIVSTNVGFVSDVLESNDEIIDSYSPERVINAINKQMIKPSRIQTKFSWKDFRQKFDVEIKYGKS